MDAATQLDLIAAAQARGYLSFPTTDRIVYHCHRRHEEDYADPEEPVRAAIYAWLILEREYPAARIDVEVPVPRRVPNDRADIVIYEDDTCRSPYLVIENADHAPIRSPVTLQSDQLFRSFRSPTM